MGGVRSRFLLLIPRIGGNVNDHLGEKKKAVSCLWLIGLRSDRQGQIECFKKKIMGHRE
jgi:hypothetical protein